MLRCARGTAGAAGGSAAVLDDFKYCELGCVSPDDPYLAITDKQALRWANT